MKQELMSLEPEVLTPEGLAVAEAYLRSGQDVAATAAYLGQPVTVVHNLLEKREVKKYIDRIFFESGYRNRDKLGAILDGVIDAKLEEMDETDMGSSKDIAELIKLQHDMKMKEMDLQIKLLGVEAKLAEASRPVIQATPTTQTNVQVLAGGEGYNKLVDRILGLNDGDK